VLGPESVRASKRLRTKKTTRRILILKLKETIFEFPFVNRIPTRF
jgi:hypothetical protein